MNSEKRSTPIENGTESQSTVTNQNHLFLPTEIIKLRHDFIQYHQKVLPILIEYAMDNNLITLLPNETIEDGIWRWLSSEETHNPNPIPLISNPFYYSTWKRDYLKYKYHAKKPDIYTLTCDALISIIEEL